MVDGNIYDIGPGDVWWTASDVGWVVGHSYIVYAPLLVGATTVLYEGKPVGTPDAGAFWRVIRGPKVSVLFTAPTALRAIRKADPDGAAAGAYDTPACAPCSGGRTAGPRDLPLGGRRSGRAGGRPLVADRDRLGRSAPTPAAWNRCRSKPARPRVPMPGFGCGSLDGAGKESRPAPRAR